MIPFTITQKERQKADHDIRRKDTIVDVASRALDHVLLAGVDHVFDRAMKGYDKFVPPPLKYFDQVFEAFYRSVVNAAVESAHSENRIVKEDVQIGKKKLAKKIPGTGIPNDIRFLEKFYRDPLWQRTVKRYSVIGKRIRKSYNDKLMRKFREAVPKLRSGDLSPEEFKASMRQAWGASRGRVESIFRTETTKYFTEVQVKFYSGDDNIIGFLFDSIRDMSRTDICRTRHGLVYRPDSRLLKINSPPCHVNCRSHLLALANTPENLKMLKDPSRDPSKRSVAPLPKGWNK